MSNDKKVINHLISIIILSTLIILFSLGELGLIIITLSLMYFIIYSIITYQTTMTNNKQSSGEELDVHSFVEPKYKTKTVKITMSNETAVDKLWNLIPKDTQNYIVKQFNGLEKAKEMEKEQREDYKYTEQDLRNAFNAGLMNKYSRIGEAVAEEEFIKNIRR